MTAAFTARLLEALPGSRPRYEAAVATCRAEGIKDAATRIFLDDYLRELLDRFRGDPDGVRLLDAVPALEPLAREHTYGDHEDVLVHPFLGGVAEREAENVASGRLAGPGLRAELMRQRGG